MDAVTDWSDGPPPDAVCPACGAPATTECFESTTEDGTPITVWWCDRHLPSMT